MQERVYQKPSLLIVDDAQMVCDILCDQLSKRGYLCVAVYNGNEALTELTTRRYDVALVDIRLPDMSGMEILAKIRSDYPATETIMITVINEVDAAVDAMKLGALDYIVKPFNLDKLDTSIRTVLEKKKRLSESRAYQAPFRLGDEEYLNRLIFIAEGVEARHNLLYGHSEMVVQETVDVARYLEIPEEEIQQWVADRAKHTAESEAAIESSLNKLEQNPLAQQIMGIDVPLITPKDDESKN